MSESLYAEELSVLNGLPESQVYDDFLRCCGSRRFATIMVSHRPFSSLNQLNDVANQTWWSQPKSEWLEAFSAHPKIGDMSSLKAKYHSKQSGAHQGGWESGEQSGADGANEEVLLELQQLNTEYEAKHGFIFLICATGKSAEEMLAALRFRMDNDTDTEVSHLMKQSANNQ